MVWKGDTMETSLENLKALVTAHRQQHKKKQYPETVWTLVTELRKRHTAKEISQATGLHETQIYKVRRASQRGVFREVKVVTPPLATVKQVSVELRRSDGAELRLRLEISGEELSNFVSGFLR
jgi:hypothetical protein